MTVWLITMAVQGQVTQNSSAEEHLARGWTAYRNKDFALARQEIKLAQAVKKELPESYLLLALVHWHEGKIGPAIKAVKEAITFQPNFPQAHYVLGRLYFEQRQWKEAGKEVRLAMEQGAKFADVYVLLGDAALTDGKYEEAVAAYEQALNQPPPNNEVTPELRTRLTAVRNLIEFRAHKNDPDYQFPQPDKSRANEIGIPATTGKIRLAGLLNEQGQFTSVIVLYADASSGKKDELIAVALRMKFTPAIRKGTPVPFWLTWIYSYSISVH